MVSSTSCDIVYYINTNWRMAKNLKNLTKYRKILWVAKSAPVFTVRFSALSETIFNSLINNLSKSSVFVSLLNSQF